MRYLLLIYGDEAAMAEMGQTVRPEDQAAELKKWTDYTAWLEEKGWHLGGEALEPTTSATTVRETDGRILSTDGPFAETKEALGGYYLIDCSNLDEAIEAASKIPSVGRGSIEVRPIMEFPEE